MRIIQVIVWMSLFFIEQSTDAVFDRIAMFWGNGGQFQNRGDVYMQYLAFKTCYCMVCRY